MERGLKNILNLPLLVTESVRGPRPAPEPRKNGAMQHTPFLKAQAHVQYAEVPFELARGARVAGHYDFIVIGSGPSGRRAAIQAAKLGKSVLVVEGRKRVGGVSVHTGTIPSKTLRETALNLSGWRERGFYGRSYRVKKEIGSEDLGIRLTKTLEHEVDVLEHQFLRNGVHTMSGFARFLDPPRLLIHSPDGSELIVEGERILIAVGPLPFRPDNIDFADPDILDSDEVVHIPHLPRSLTVVGAGVVGIEYATIFPALDVQVTIIEPRPTFLDFVDHEILEE